MGRRAVVSVSAETERATFEEKVAYFEVEIAAYYAVHPKAARFLIAQSRPTEESPNRIAFDEALRRCRVRRATTLSIRLRRVFNVALGVLVVTLVGVYFYGLR